MRGQDLAGEVTLSAPRVHDGRVERDRAWSRVNCRFMVRLARAHDHRVPVFVSGAAESLDILLDPQLRHLEDHFTSPLPWRPGPAAGGSRQFVVQGPS